MARKTIQIPLEDYFGYVNQQYPNQVYSVSQDGEYVITPYRISEYSESTQKERLFYLKVGSFPNTLKYQRLYDFQYVMQMYYSPPTDADKQGVGCAIQSVNEFDKRTLNYNTKPSTTSGTAVASAYYKEITAAGGQNAWADVTGHPYDASGNYPKLASQNTQRALRLKYFKMFSGGFECTGSNYSMHVAVKPRLHDGSMPYIIVTYDDTETVPGQVELIDKITGQIDQGIDHTITWNITEKKYSDTDWFCFAQSWEQTSATIYWREQGAATWNEIQIAGDTKEYTFPARTFGSNKTYEYYASANDISGGSSETATFTFTTPRSQLTPQSSPVSGYVNPREATSFSWSYSTASGSVAAGSTVLHWREQGASSWTDVQAASGANSLTIAANTFSPLKVYEWYLSGEDTYGYASSTSVYSFSTSAAQITSNPIAPINSIENKNEAITFKWDFSSQDSAPASACTLQYKYISDSSWTTIQSFNTGVKTYDVPASTFDAGAIEWRVIPYNIDGVEGTAAVASFISYGAPVAPTVYTNGAPFLTINWQAEEQESYQIMVDDESFGPYFGTEKSFTLPDFLSDGSHSVKVRVMGVYGLWSKWGNTDITIENQPGSDVLLTYVSGIDCLLNWETVETENDFRIYRDEKQIGKTDKNEFNDSLVLGEHTYKVINRLDDGNYSESNEVTVTMVVAETMIASLNGGEWLPITYSLKDSSDPQFQETVETVYSHFYGNVYPSAFISGYRESNMSFSAVFFYNQAEEEAKFLSLLGQPVILKFKSGAVFIGVLDNWSRQARKEYWTGYTFTLRRVDWEDFVDDTQ